MKLRVRYSKLGKIRFVSHRDGARLWERALRRVAFPVATTEGFTPRPKLGFGLALPTGAESVAEYIDIDLVQGAEIDVDDRSVNEALSSALPIGMDVLVMAERDPAAASLQDDVGSTTWELTGLGVEPEQLGMAIQRVLASDELFVERERKGRRRTDDVRPLIRDLRLEPVSDVLVAELVTVGRALRPTELAGALVPDVDPLDVRVLRTHQWIDHDDERREVLPLPIDVDALDRGLSA
mgnify:FL=1